MAFDLILRAARIAGREDHVVDIGIAGGRIAAIEPTLPAGGPEERVEGCLVAPGFVETHILDKSRISDRCTIRDADHNVPRGVTRADRLQAHGVTCSLATNNVLNPFTPFGDCSLTRMANLYANIARLGRREELEGCLAMITTSAAKLMNLASYGIAPGHPADLVALPSATGAIAELARPLFGLKRGRRTFTNTPGRLYPPG